MTTAEQIAAFALRARESDFTPGARNRLKHNIVDALGCAIGAINGEPVKASRALNEEPGGTPQCTMLGGGKTALTGLHCTTLHCSAAWISRNHCSSG